MRFLISPVTVVLPAAVLCTMTAATAQAAKKTAVQAVVVTEEPIGRTSNQPATVHAFETAEIEARLSGYVASAPAEIGDAVTAGTLLATISVPEMERELEVLEAEVTRAEAHAAQSAAGVTLAQADVDAAEARKKQAESMMASVEALVTASEAEFDRTSALVDRRSVQPKMLDEARSRRDAQRANRESTRSSIDAAEADVTVARAKLDAARADQQAADAMTQVAAKKRDELAERLKYASIRAPFDGIVTARDVSPGDLVRETARASNGRPLFVVKQVAKVRVHIPVPEIDAAFVKTGDPLTLTFPSFAGEKPIEATVTRVAGSLDPSTRSMLVEAELPNENGKLIPGMFGQASIRIDAGAVAQVLPARAIRFEGDSPFVYALGDDDTIEIVPIETGRDNGTTIQIVSGLETGQRVVGASLGRFVDGQSVRVIDN